MPARVQGGDDGSGSLEYLVFQSVLVALAKEQGLHPVTDYGDDELDSVLSESTVRRDGSSVFRRFKASFAGKHPSLEVASQLNCAFVFRKGGPASSAVGGTRQPAAGVKRQREEDSDDEGGAPTGVPAGDAAAAAAALEESRLAGVQASYAAPQFKRSSKFKRAA